MEDQDIRESIRELRHAVDGIAKIVDRNGKYVAIMWNWKYVVASVFGLIIGGLFFMIQGSKTEMDENRRTTDIMIEAARVLVTANRESSVLRDQQLADRFLDLHEQNARVASDIIRVMQVFSINQKRVLDKLQLDYMEPDKIQDR